MTIDHTYSINNPCLQDVDGAERITRFTILYGGAQSRDTRVNKQIDVYASQVLSAIIHTVYIQQWRKTTIIAKQTQNIDEIEPPDLKGSALRLLKGQCPKENGSDSASR